MSSLLVKGGQVILPDLTFKADIYIEDGKVKSLSSNLSVQADSVINAEGKLVFPGAIDEHVHCREPGLTYKDNFTNCTKAAAAGGVTTILEMPNTLPPVENAQTLKEKRELLKAKAYVDFGLYGVLHDSNLDQFEFMLNEGAIGFKVFLGPTTGNIPPPNDGSLYRIMEKSAKYDATIAFHAENNDIVNFFTNELMKKDTSEPIDHMFARPPIAEEEAIKRIGLFAMRTGGKALIVHTSSQLGVKAIKELRSKGAKIYGETCPHYLLLNENDYKKYGILMKVNPPIRKEEDQLSLLHGIADGTITNIGSDHAPHSEEEKKGNIWQAASGFIGVQTTFPLLLDMALKGLIRVDQLPYLLSESPAKLFGLYPEKGTLQVNSSGDLIIVDPKGSWKIKEEDLYATYPITPFIGWELRGKIKYTILKGKIIYDENQPIGPTGNFIRKGFLTSSDLKY
jgi:dihydroorotase